MSEKLEYFKKKIHDERYSIDLLADDFSDLSDNDSAWQYLIDLIQDDDYFLRWRAAYVLGLAFRYVSDKKEAWMNLHKMNSSFYINGYEDDYPGPYRWSLAPRRSEVACVLGLAFQYIPDKLQAWLDLHNAVYSDDEYVRCSVAEALGLAFQYLLDKQLAIGDLIWLTGDEEGTVRMLAFHSLGKVFILKATEAKDAKVLKSELESAIAYFERSSQEQELWNPSKFCLPFYRTYYAITFQEAKGNAVQKYLAEAKKAVGGSESKDELFKAIENLAEALREAQRLKDRPLSEVLSELNTYRWYCEKASEYMAAAEDKAPYAVNLMRRGNPILEKRIQDIITEIQKKSKLIGPEIERETRCLSLGDPIKTYQCSMRIASNLRSLSSRLPQELRQSTLSVLADIEKDKDLSEVLGKIELAMAYTLSVVEAERNDVLDRLKNIEFSMAKLSLSSGSARQDLYQLKTIINDFQDVAKSNGFSKEELSKILQERDNAMIERLEKIREKWLLAVEEMTRGVPSCNATDEILKEIQVLRASRKTDLLGITGDISSIAGLFIGLIGLAVAI